MILSNLSLIACLVGLIVYLAAGHPKVSEAGRIAYWTGLAFFLYFGVKT